MYVVKPEILDELYKEYARATIHLKRFKNIEDESNYSFYRGYRNGVNYTIGQVFGKFITKATIKDGLYIELEINNNSYNAITYSLMSLFAESDLFERYINGL